MQGFVFFKILFLMLPLVTYAEVESLGTKDSFEKIGTKMGGVSPGFLAQKEGQQYMLKIATGYLNAVSNGPDDAHLSEIIAAKVFQKVLGRNYAPDLFLVEETEKGVEGNKTLLASKWLHHSRSIRPNYEKNGLIETVPGARRNMITKILTLAKILNVDDFKPDHVMEHYDSEGDLQHLFIVDCESHFGSFKSFTKENLLHPSYDRVKIEDLDPGVVFDTTRRFAELTDQEIDEITALSPEIGSFYAASFIGDINTRIKEVRNNMLTIIEGWGPDNINCVEESEISSVLSNIDELSSVIDML